MRPVPARGGTVTTASAIDVGNVVALCLLVADGNLASSCADLLDATGGTPGPDFNHKR